MSDNTEQSEATLAGPKCRRPEWVWLIAGYLGLHIFGGMREVGWIADHGFLSMVSVFIPPYPAEAPLAVYNGLIVWSKLAVGVVCTITAGVAIWWPRRLRGWMWAVGFIYASREVIALLRRAVRQEALGAAPESFWVWWANLNEIALHLGPVLVILVFLHTGRRREFFT